MLKITKNQGSIQVTADNSGFYPFDGTITFPTNSLFTATSANTDMITFKSTSNGDVQFVGNYKDITISGRSYDTKQKFLTAFSNLANQGSVDAYTKAETDAKMDAKQGKLKAGNGITLTEDATDGTTVVKTAVSLTDNGNGAYEVGDSIGIGGRSSVRIGNNTSDVLQGQNSIVIGDDASTNKENCIVIGNSTNTGFYAAECVVIGDHADAADNYCTVIGTNASSNGSRSVAIGNSAYADSVASCSVAVGSEARAYGKNSVALGYLSYATNDKPLDICCGKDAGNSPLRVLQSDATGKLSILKGDDSDERMVIQDEIEALKNAGGGGSVDAYTKAETDTKLDAKQDKLTAGSGITIVKDETAGTSTIATAVSLTDNGNGAYQVGDKIEIGGRSSVRIGNNNNVLQGQNSIVIGDHVLTNSEKCIAIGNSSEVNVSSDYSIVIGDSAIANGAFSSAIGTEANVNGTFSSAIGYNANVNGAFSSAIGYSASAEDYYTVSIGGMSRANKDTPLVINAGYNTADNSKKPLTVLQSDANGKISLLKGDGTDERIVIQDEIAALKNAGGSGGGTVDAYTKAETDNLLNAKQNTLTAGTGITIDENNVISSTGGSGGGANPLVAVKGTDSAIISDNVTNAIAIGNDAKVTQENGVAVGSGTKAFGGKSVAVGYQTSSQGEFSVGIGSGAMASGQYGIAVGHLASSVDDISVAIGSGAIASADTPMVINAGGKTMIQSDENGKISLLKGDGTKTRMVIQDEIAALKAEIAALKGGASTGA